MEEDEVNAGFFELVEAFGNLLGGADEAGAETAVRYGVVFKRDTLFELCAGKPLLIVGVTGGGLLDVGDAADFVLRFFFGFSDDGITCDAELQRR